MSNVLKFAGSSVPGSVPAVLDGGEIGINTADGKVFVTKTVHSAGRDSSGDWAGVSKLPDLDVMPSDFGNGCTFSADGNYMSVLQSGTPFINLYKKSGSTFVKLPNPDVLPPSRATKCSFSPDGIHLAVTHAFSPFITIYKRNGDTFTKLANPSVLPAQIGQDVKFSADGTYLAVGHQNTPFITIYKRSGDTFTKLANPTPLLPSSNVLGVNFSADGTYLALGTSSSPFIYVYKRSGDTFTMLTAGTNVPALPNQGQDVVFSPDGTYLAVAHSTSPFITIYKRSGDTFTKLPNPNVLPPDQGMGVAFTKDGRCLAISHYSSPYVTLYLKDGDTFTKLTNPKTLLPGGAAPLDIAFSPNDMLLAVAHTMGSNLTIYKSNALNVVALGEQIDRFAGEIIESGNPNLGEPYYIPADGSSYDSGVWPKLDPIYGREGADWSAASKLADPATPPVSLGYTVNFSPDSSYLGVGHLNTPFVSFYKRSGDVFTKLANPAALPASSVRGLTFSPNGDYAATSHANSPYLAIYKQSGDTFTKLANPAALPTGNGRGVAFSPDSTYMAIAHDTTPFITIYKRSGDTFTKLPNPSTLPKGNGLGVAFSPDGSYLAVIYGSGPYISVYKREGDVFTELPKLSPSPSNISGSGGVTFSPDGVHLVIGYSLSPYIIIYRRDGDTFTKVPDPDVSPPNYVNGVAFSPDSKYLSVVSGGPDSVILIYKRNGDVFTKIPDLNVLPTSVALSAAFSPDNQYLAVGHQTGPTYMNLYKVGSSISSITVPNIPSSDPKTRMLIYTGDDSVYVPTGVIGVAGTQGFGVGVCPDDAWLLELGLSEMEGTRDKNHENYGNYQHTNGGISVFVPKFYYSIGDAASPQYAKYGVNSISIRGVDTFSGEAAANVAGYALHRAFIDAGKEKPGFFYDKYLASKDGTVSCKSVKNAHPISLDTTAEYSPSGTMVGCTGIIADAVVLSRARGYGWNTVSIFMTDAIAKLALAHGQAATDNSACAWYDPNGVTNFPKGCNSGSLTDVNDSTVTFTAAYSSKPLTGSASNLAKTTHNGQANGITDVNGAMQQVTIGITTAGTTATSGNQITSGGTNYVLKTTAKFADLTSGFNGPTDAWGSTALASRFDSITLIPWGAATGWIYFGNSTNQVFSGATAGTNYLRSCCGIQTSSSSVSAVGTALFGTDGCYQYLRQNNVITVAGYWGVGYPAGVFCKTWNDARAFNHMYYGFRAASYGS